MIVAFSSSSKRKRSFSSRATKGKGGATEKMDAIDGAPFAHQEAEWPTARLACTVPRSCKLRYARGTAPTVAFAPCGGMFYRSKPRDPSRNGEPQALASGPRP